jgi:hypothetical protein
VRVFGPPTNIAVSWFRCISLLHTGGANVALCASYHASTFSFTASSLIVVVAAFWQKKNMRFFDDSSMTVENKKISSDRSARNHRFTERRQNKVDWTAIMDRAET